MKLLKVTSALLGLLIIIALSSCKVQKYASNQPHEGSDKCVNQKASRNTGGFDY